MLEHLIAQLDGGTGILHNWHGQHSHQDQLTLAIELPGVHESVVGD